MTFNHGVEGSSPSALTIEIKDLGDLHENFRNAAAPSIDTCRESRLTHSVYPSWTPFTILTGSANATITLGSNSSIGPIAGYQFALNRSRVSARR